VNPDIRRRIRWSAIGFLIAFILVTALVLADGLETANFEALNQLSRPVNVRGWVAFALLSLDLYIVAGVFGALVGFVGSFARPVKSRKRVVGWVLIVCGLGMATISVGSVRGNFLEFLDSGAGTAPASHGEMGQIYLLEFCLIAVGASLVWMGHRPRAA
jgi:hypothetical protein